MKESGFESYFGARFAVEDSALTCEMSMSSFPHGGGVNGEHFVGRHRCRTVHAHAQPRIVCSEEGGVHDHCGVQAGAQGYEFCVPEFQRHSRDLHAVTTNVRRARRKNCYRFATTLCRINAS